MKEYGKPELQRAQDILTQAASEVAAQLEAQKEDILREVLRARRPELAELPKEELGARLTAYTFGPGYQLLMETETGEPLVFFTPPTTETKFEGICASFVSNIKYLQGHAGAQEFYRIRAQYNLMD